MNEAVIDVVVNQCLLGVRDGLLHGVQLLRELHAFAAFFDHVDDRREMTLGAAQPPDDLRVRRVSVVPCHRAKPIPWEGMPQPERV